jgi:hypothetical protein
MYRCAQNMALMNAKQWRPAKVTLLGEKNVEKVYYERPPLYLNLFYLVSVHSKFRSDAERLVGWLLMRLYDASHLVYRPRKYFLPEGRMVDSTGADWNLENDGDDVIMEKVALSLVDDLTIGDAINFYTIAEAPFRPFLTYRAQCSMEGPLVAGPPTQVRHHRATLKPEHDENPDRRNGRLGRVPLLGGKPKMLIGPPGFGHKPIPEDDPSSTPDRDDSHPSARPPAVLDESRSTATKPTGGRRPSSTPENDENDQESED